MGERLRMIRTLTDLVREGKLESPEHEILVVGSQESDSDAADKIRSAISRLGGGKYGKKVLLKVEETQ